MLSNFGKSAIALTIYAAIGSTLPVQAALLVSSTGDNSIKQYDETTGAYIRDFVTSGSGGLLNPQGLNLGTNGNLFVSSFGTDSVKEYDGKTGEYIRDFVSSSSGLVDPKGLAFAEDGSLLVTAERIPGASAGKNFGPENTYSSGLLRYDGTTGEFLGSIITAIAPNTVGTIRVAQDVVFGGPDGTLFVTQSIARRNPGFITEHDPTTGDVVDRYDPVGFDNPVGLVVSENVLFYTSYSGVGRVDLTTGTTNPLFVVGGSGGLRESVDVAIGENSNLLVSSFDTNSVKQYDSATGNFLGDFVASSSGGLLGPSYITTASVPIPEPSSVLGVITLGGLFVAGALQRQANSKK